MQAAATQKQLQGFSQSRAKAKPELILGCDCFDFTCLSPVLITLICRGISLKNTHLDNRYYHTQSIMHI